ncbi:GntR family transcriptional regulator [Pseudomonas oryzihabitans]|uniref:GntR family transcriptional regulator n=1 Tax=Pseudomonas oryzihabitans TaxID=47885 RepID=A0ABX3IW80_9PSED|nr:GntR family transcriptional regulator [Pseudomonas psychrotolerans]ONN71253.1 GntR family transcriptional regulator [Pseudomonas psychrotolerans]
MKKDLAEQLAPRIIDLARARSMQAGDPLREEAFARELGVSRSPVRRGFALLEQLGLVQKEPNRGFFLTRNATTIEQAALPSEDDPYEELYLRVVDDMLRGDIRRTFFEAELLRRYEIPRGQLLRVLNRLANEAMIDRRPGQGWELKTFLHDSEAHVQSYRFRMAIEPFALREPGYQIDKRAFSQARQRQQRLLDGELFTLSRAQLFEIGSSFHELLVRCSGNVFLLEAIRRQNQLRRFMAYRSNVNRSRQIGQSQEHLHILDLLEGASREEAAAYLHQHLDVVSRLKTAQDRQLESAAENKAKKPV